MGWSRARSCFARGITRDEITHTALPRRAVAGTSAASTGSGTARRACEARYLAAVWACGDGAVLSGRAAAHLWGILKGAAPPPEVTAPASGAVAGVTTHARAASRQPPTAAIPITTVPRTLVDLAADLSLDALARACHEAGVLHDTTPRQVEAVLAKRPKTKGATKLRAVLRGDVQ